MAQGAAIFVKLMLKLSLLVQTKLANAQTEREKLHAIADVH